MYVKIDRINLEQIFAYRRPIKIAYAQTRERSHDSFAKTIPETSSTISKQNFDHQTDGDSRANVEWFQRTYAL